MHVIEKEDMKMLSARPDLCALPRAVIVLLDYVLHFNYSNID